VSDHSVPRPPCTTIALPHSQSLIGTHSHSPPTVRLLTHSLAHSLSLTVAHCVHCQSVSQAHSHSVSQRQSLSQSLPHTQSLPPLRSFVRLCVRSFVRLFVCSLSLCCCFIFIFDCFVALRPSFRQTIPRVADRRRRRLDATAFGVDRVFATRLKRSFQVSSMKCKLLTRKNAAEG